MNHATQKVQYTEFNGKTYITISDHTPTGEYMGCVSCHLYDTSACISVSNKFNSCRNIIWEQVPDNETYTVSDFVEAISNDYILSDEQIGMIVQYLRLKSDPEYQQYLELKKKFEK